MDHPRILLLDAAPGPLLDRELERLTGHRLAVTLNLRRVEDRARARSAWSDRIEFTDFDPFDETALVAEFRRGQGYDALKSRAGVPLRAAFLAAATATDADTGTATTTAPVTLPERPRPLRVIGRAGAGTDHVDLAAAARHGVTVTHTPGSNANAVAEFALAQLLTLTRDLVIHNERSHRGTWGAPATPPRELSDLTLGIVGPGLIGTALATRARALGMTVQAHARRPPARPIRHVPSLHALLATSDVVSLHVPLTP